MTAAASSGKPCRPQRHAEHRRGEQDGDERLGQPDRDVEQHLADEVLRAADRIGQHLVEDAVVAVHEERPRGVRRDAEAGHPEDAREEERVVVGRQAREAERLVHADAEHQQIPERIDDVPEDEQGVGRPDLSLAIHHRRQALTMPSLTICGRGAPSLRQLDEDVFEARAADLEAQHAPARRQRADDGQDAAVVLPSTSPRRCSA